MTIEADDFHWMGESLRAAQDAAKLGEVPVGAVVVNETGLISLAFNRRETTHSPTAHAEILAIEAAAKKLERWRLSDCTLYVTLEPCVMCAGAIINARLNRVIFGAHDPKAGAVDSLYQVLADKRLNHRPISLSGVRSDECGKILRDFFLARRNQRGV